MKNILLLITTTFIFSAGISAQNKQPKIVFDISASDTAVQSTVLRQVNNILKAAPQAKIEVVFHGKAVYALVRYKSTFQDKIDELANNRHVVFAACNNSLIRLNISKDELLSYATVVPVAILELADKQEKGWSYIKAGQ